MATNVVNGDCSGQAEKWKASGGNLDTFPREVGPARISLGMWVVNLVAVVAPFLGLVAAAVSLWGRGFSWVHLGLRLGMYALTALGVTVGFHRLFSHRAFETNRVIQFLLAALGSMAAEGPLLKWVALH